MVESTLKSSKHWEGVKLIERSFNPQKTLIARCGRFAPQLLLSILGTIVSKLRAYRKSILLASDIIILERARALVS